MSGRATIWIGQRMEEVTAVELGFTDAGAFMRDVVPPHAHRTRFGEWFVRNIDKIDIDNPEKPAGGDQSSSSTRWAAR
jgi:hypothetical protein